MQETWINPRGGSWDTASNWSPAGVPQGNPYSGQGSDNLTFALSRNAFFPATYTITGGIDYANNLTVSTDHVTFNDQMLKGDGRVSD